jgi:hypothetical protein
MLDRAAHAALARLSTGLSPASASLAMLDWAQHLAIAPGKWIDLMAQFAQSAVLGPVQSSADPRFAAPSWIVGPTAPGAMHSCAGNNGAKARQVAVGASSVITKR